MTTVALTSGVRAGTIGRQWWLVSVLTIVSMLAYVDKNIVALMIGSMGRDLQLSPAQATLAIGTAFAVANILISVPAGWLADRGNRRVLVWVAVALWSVMTMLCGWAEGLFSLLVIRAGIGLAEGLLPPACYSLIRDAVTPVQRARALGVFAMSNLAGTGLALLGGGLLLGFIVTHDLSSLPLVGRLKPWGMALFATGLIGLPLSLLVFTFREPVRLTDRESAAGPGSRDVLAALWQLRRIFLPLAIFSIAHSMLSQSINLWVAPLLSSRFGLSPAQIGVPLGIILLVSGAIGLVGAGIVIDRLDRRSGRGAQTIAVAVSLLLVVTAIAHPLAPSIGVFWIWQAILLLGSTTYILVTSSLVARVLPRAMTGRAIALYIMIQGLFGLGLAPTLTAVAVETVFAGATNPIAAAMAAMHGVYALIALAAAWYLYRQPLPAPER